MRTWANRLLPVLLICGCVNSPTTDEPETDASMSGLTLWPGYCVAENELDGADGPDGRRVAEYDGELLVRDEFDSDLDGDVDVVTTYEYDADDQLETLTIDEFADGEPDEIRRFEWSDGRLMRETWDQNADGEVDVDIAYTHDEQGRRVRGEGQRNSNPDPEVDIVLRFEWEGDLLVSLYVDGFAAPADGTFERTIFYAYDTVGNLTTAIFDFDGNGTADMVVSYDYACWT